MIRWTMYRKWQDNGNLMAWLDDIQFPLLLTGDDYNAVKRWYYDGERVRRARFWAWPLRDQEQTTDITERVSTVPDFITIDSQGRVLYGNCHYTCRIIVNDIDNDLYPDGKLDTDFFDKGYARFTASPAIAPPPQVQNGNCEWVDQVTVVEDPVADPHHGAFEILPLAHSIQLRGCNSAPRDSNVDSIFRESYPNEQFANVSGVGTGGSWNGRWSCWTLIEEGKLMIPHVEVIWRPNYDQPSFPVPPDPGVDGGYPVHPWPIDMEADSNVLQENELIDAHAVPTFCRVRDPKAFPQKITGDPDTKKPVWNSVNVVAPRIYGDCYSRQPQYAWARWDGTLYPDPADDSDLSWDSLPWPSVDWWMIVAQHCPSAAHGSPLSNNYVGRPSNNGCPNCSSDESQPNYQPNCAPDTDWHWTWTVPVMTIGGGFTSFDAVDCDCCQ